MSTQPKGAEKNNSLIQQEIKGQLVSVKKQQWDTWSKATLYNYGGNDFSKTSVENPKAKNIFGFIKDRSILRGYHSFSNQDHN